MAAMTVFPGKLSGTVAVPPSKSMMHRAIICTALAGGVSHLTPAALSKDIEATLSGMRTLGSGFSWEDGALCIRGRSETPRPETIDCNESGSTLRFLFPVALALTGRAAFTGRGRLGERPMGPYFELLREMGVTVRQGENGFPLEAEGSLKSGVLRLTGGVSSQFVTGLMLALPLLEGDSLIELTSPLESKSYVDLTIGAMRAFGVRADWTDERHLSVPGNQRYQACDFRVEGDYSQAAVFLCADALGAEVWLDGLTEDSAQGDRAVLSVLQRMGAQIVWREGKVCATAPGGLHGTVIDARDCPDIIPILALTAALAQGETRIINAGRLRLKECDRLHATCRELNRLGARLEEHEDGMTIIGVEHLTGGVTANCHRDHRMAMMLSIAALDARLSVTLDDFSCVSKSYPNFFENFIALGGAVCGQQLG